MAEFPKTLVKLATELVKYYAEKILGEGASAILVKGLTDIVGENATEKINGFLDQGERAQQLLEAFTLADDCYSKKVDDDLLRQLILSQPFAALPQLEVLAKALPTTLDDIGLFNAIRDQFKKDWPGRLADQQIDVAARTYLDCLDQGLATKFDQLLPTLYRKVDRIDHTSRQIKANTDLLIEGQGKIEAQLEKLANKNLEPNQTPDYREYLAHVVTELKEWEVRYAPMFAKFERLSLFARVRAATSQPEQLLELIQKSNKLVILGPAGSGKTTTLQRVTLENAQKAFLGEINAHIPILIPLRDYGEGGIKRLIETTIKPWGLSYNHIESDLVLGKFSLILDGLNEIPIGQREMAFQDFRRLINEYPNNRFFYTSRTLEYQASWLSSGNTEIPVCEIQSLTRGQIENYILRYFDGYENLANQLVKQLQLHDNKVWEDRKSLVRLAGVPLLLQMLILTFEDQKRIPRNEGELLLRFVDEILFRREPGKSAGKFDPETKKKLLASIAWSMYEFQNAVAIPKRHAYSVCLWRLDELKGTGEAPRSYDGQEVWLEIQNNHLLIEKDDIVYWPHPLYLELFVGLSLRDACFNELWEPRYTEIALKFRPFDAKWYADPAFDAGITMLEVIPHQFRIQALTAVACINPSLSKEAYLKMEPDYTPGLRNEFINQLAIQAVSPEREGSYHRNLVDTLGLLRDNAVCVPLKDIGIACPSWEGREQAVIEVWMNCRETSSLEIIQYIEGVSRSDSDTRVRRKALSFLIGQANKHNQPDIVLFIVERLLQESFGFVNDPQVNFKTILNSSTALGKLSKIAGDMSEGVDNRCRAIWALGVSGIRNIEIQNMIIRLAKTAKQFEVRKSAVEVLKNFSSKATINALKFILQKESYSVIREEAIYSLRACSDNNTTPILIQALKDPEKDVGDAAVSALVDIYNKRNVLKYLTEEATSANTLSRNRSLVALSKIASIAEDDLAVSAAREISYHSREPDNFTLLEIASGLRKFNLQQSNEILKKLLSDDDPLIRELASQKFDELGEEL
jgi:hypothetical protein